MHKAIALAILFTMTFWFAPGKSRGATISDRDVVVACIILEAGGEGHDGMVAVFNVIENRSARHNRALRKVVLRKYQFSCYNSVTVDKSKTLGQVVDRAKRHPKWGEAMGIYLGKPSDITNGSDHYFADYISPPSWARTMTFMVKIGKHIFYRSN